MMKKPFTKKQFETKRKELAGLVARLEIMPVSGDKEEGVSFLFDKLEKEMHLLECEFLQTKLDGYKRVYEFIIGKS
jgi:hypothetical protein